MSQNANPGMGGMPVFLPKRAHWDGSPRSALFIALCAAWLLGPFAAVALVPMAALAFAVSSGRTLQDANAIRTFAVVVFGTVGVLCFMGGLWHLLAIPFIILVCLSL